MLRRGLATVKCLTAIVLIKDQKPVVLLLKNIKSEWVPRIPSFKFEVLTSKEIQTRANREGEFFYLHFPLMEVLAQV
jgi:hypothetical protein